MGDLISSGLKMAGNLIGGNKQTGEYKGAIRTIDNKYNKGVGNLYEQYGTADDIMQPYAQAGPEALAMLQSAIYGGERSYADPRYQQMSEYDLGQLNNESADDARNAYLNSQGKMSAEQKKRLKQSLGVSKLSKGMINQYLSSNGGYTRQSGVNPKDARAALAAKLTPANIYDTGKTYYRGPNGEIIEGGKVPQMTASFNPQESALYKLQKDRGLADMDRILRMNGRGNSTYGVRENGRFLEDLNANESERQLGRLKELLGVGTTAATNQASLHTGLGNNLATMYQNWAAKKASAKQSLGDVQLQKWSQLGSDSGDMVKKMEETAAKIFSGGMGGAPGAGGMGGGGGGMSFVANGAGKWGQGGYYGG